MMENFGKEEQRKVSGGELIMASLGCIFLSALICLGQITANMILIAAFFAGLLAICIWACMKDIILPILLYFLPWSPLMKFYKGGISFFTVMLLVVCLAALIKNKMSLNMYQIVLTAMIAILTAIAKMVQENDIANSYIFFLAMLFLLPCITKRIDSDSFNETTIFFASGIITAALSAQQLVVYHNIAQYITVDSYLTITRLSGYYGDPNFYSAHITACLAGILMLLSREKDRVRQAVLIIVAVLLVYCGMLSASKMFVIVLACLFFFWIPVLMEKSGRGNGRLRMFVGILCAGGIFLSSSAFKELFRIIDDRFAYDAANVSRITTGRTDIWKNYLNYFIENIDVTILGEGYTPINLNGRASHNTVIQAVFQFGLIGIPLLAAWMYFFLKDIFQSAEKSKTDWRYAMLMCVGVALPWMSLDILFFDEFFLMSLYAAVGITCMSKSEPTIEACCSSREIKIN